MITNPCLLHIHKDYTTNREHVPYGTPRRRESLGPGLPDVSIHSSDVAPSEPSTTAPPFLPATFHGSPIPRPATVPPSLRSPPVTPLRSIACTISDSDDDDDEEGDEQTHPKRPLREGAPAGNSTMLDDSADRTEDVSLSNTILITIITFYLISYFVIY